MKQLKKNGVYEKDLKKGLNESDDRIENTRYNQE